MTDEKVCPKCSIGYPATTEFFYARKDSKDGFRNECRFCHSLDSKIYYQRNRQERLKKVKSYYRKQHPTIIGYLRRLFQVIKDRCTNSNHPHYHRYGGRGIKLKFKSPDEFINYVMGALKVDPRKLQIDRINNNGHYEPDNIRFVTAKVNSNNRG